MEGAGVSRGSEAEQTPQPGWGAGSGQRDPPPPSRASPPGAYLVGRAGALRAGGAGPWDRAAAAAAAGRGGWWQRRRGRRRRRRRPRRGRVAVGPGRGSGIPAPQPGGGPRTIPGGVSGPPAGALVPSARGYLGPSAPRGPGRLRSPQPWGALVPSARGAAVPSAPGPRRGSGPLSPGAWSGPFPSSPGCPSGGVRSPPPPPAPGCLGGRVVPSARLGPWEWAQSPQPGGLRSPPPWWGLRTPLRPGLGPPSAQGLPGRLSWLGCEGRRLPTLEEAGGVHRERGGEEIRPILAASRAVALAPGLRRLPGSEVCWVTAAGGSWGWRGCKGELGVRSRGLAIISTLAGRCAPCLLVKLLADWQAGLFGFFWVYNACGCLFTVFLLEALFWSRFLIYSVLCENLIKEGLGALRHCKYARQGWKEREKSLICKKWELCHIDLVLMKLSEGGSLS